MAKLKIGICDDEIIILELLKDIVTDCLAENEVDAEIVTFQSGKALIEDATEFDVVFLDIEMPELNGIETGKIIKERKPNCKIIIATSKEEYYKEGYKIDALRYITKPFDMHEIEEALEAVQKSRVGTDKIQLYYNRTLIEIKHRSIEYVVAYDSYVEFVLKDKVLRKPISLNELEEILDTRIFFRIHRKNLVNMLYIQAYKDGIITIGDKQMTVSKRKKKEFEKAYIECDLNYK